MRRQRPPCPFPDTEHVLGPAVTGQPPGGPTPDDKGEFSYHDGPTTSAPMPSPTVPDPRLYGTTPVPNLMEKVKAKAKDLTGN